MPLNAPYTYPASLLDERERLLATIGSFWSEIFTDEATLSSFLHARAQLDVQTQLDFMELLSSISRFNVPVFHIDNWYSLTLRLTDKDAADLLIPRFDGTAVFADPAEIQFGQQLERPFHAWQAPASLKTAPVILNRIVASSLTLTHGVDYVLQDGVLLFRDNPFESPWVPVRDIYEEGRIVDRELQLWIYRGEFDWTTVYKQFGAVIGLQLPSSDVYKRLVNGVFDSIVRGPSRRNVLDIFSAVCDVPLARGEETVQEIRADSRALWIITDKHAYECHLDATAVVSVGDVLQAGDTLTDTLAYHEFNRGQAPTPEQLRSLALGKGYLSEGYYGDLVFRNETLATTVTEPSAETGEYTRIEFPVDGAPGDVIRFWDDVHESGTAAGETFAMLLDTRTDKTGQPTAAALPTAINPLRFLCENILRANYGLVIVKPTTFGRNSPGLHHARILRRVVPPPTAILLYVELELGSDEIIMNGTGDETEPGVEEDFDTFLIGTFTDEIDPNDLVEENLRFRQVQGQCI